MVNAEYCKRSWWACSAFSKEVQQEAERANNVKEKKR